MTERDDLVVGPGTPTPAGRRRGMAIGAAAVVALLLTAAVSYRWGSAGTPQAAPTVTPAATPTRGPTTAEIYQTLAPSVVTIEAMTGGATTVNSTGTGVVVNADG